MRLIPLILLLSVSPSFAQRLSINMAQIDSLHLPYSLSELTKYFRNKLPENDPDVIQRTSRVVEHFCNLKTATEELHLLSLEAANLKAIWDLNLELARKGDINDLQLLASHNAYLNKKIAVISKERECRNYLIAIVRLCYLRIIINEGKDDAQKRTTDSSSD